MKQRIDTYFNELMPLYINGRLVGIRRRLFETWLQRSSTGRVRLDQLNTVRLASMAGPEGPSSAVWSQIRAEIRSEKPALPVLQTETWRLGMGLAVLLILLAWFFFPPSVVLEWRVEGSIPQEFLVYRAEPGSQDFVLAQEIAVEDSVTAYRFVDLQLVPGRQLTYKIEAIGANGATLTSQLVVPSAGIALPNQLALFLSLGVVLYGLAVLAVRRSHWSESGLMLRTG